MKNTYNNTKKKLEKFSPEWYARAENHKDKVKFVISGSTAAGADFFFLFLLHGVLEINVVSAAIGAFIVAFFISFYLQKFWTFRDTSRRRMYKQMAIYFLVAATGLTYTAFGIYLLVEKFEIWYLFAQAMVSVTLAVGNFLIYKLVIFKKRRKEAMRSESE